ncbi:F-box [Glarea lozoyensis ATCC 20868]|uniref:F-box n=1 Tax=Glarea lozoyensis (strain ATCC 20868 / MF5171) TaxID=1116229 RepID=S3CHI3_GLAL2|nr:F-box [Glarea lozoyensis ATCC 20868]EPE25290.1 F-box [Glarea lozoyensis ATCC 20868]
MPTTLTTLPPELLLTILTHLDIPDLHALTRTSHALRHLSTDPLLHTTRLQRVPAALNHSLNARPSLASLIAKQIYVTRTTVVARRLGRDFIRIRLERELGGRGVGV